MKTINKLATTWKTGPCRCILLESLYPEWYRIYSSELCLAPDTRIRPVFRFTRWRWKDIRARKHETARYNTAKFKDVSFLSVSWCTLYLHACQVRVAIGDSGLCCCVRVTSFEYWLPPLFCGFNGPRPNMAVTMHETPQEKNHIKKLWTIASWPPTGQSGQLCVGSGPVH